MSDSTKKINTYFYEDIEAYLESINYLFVFGDVEMEEDLDDEELMDLNQIRDDFKNCSITADTLIILSKYLWGCGGSENLYEISEDVISLLDSNQKAIEWLKNNITVKEYHHCDDWSEMLCSIYKIGKYWFINSFLPG
jgi:hypothetical protein